MCINCAFIFQTFVYVNLSYRSYVEVIKMNEKNKKNKEFVMISTVKAILKIWEKTHHGNTRQFAL